MKQEYTLSVFTESKTGVLARVISTFTKRHINIESLNASPSSMEGIYRFIIVVILDEEAVVKLVQQLDKQIDVIKAFHYRNEEMVYQEVAMYKVPTKSFINGNIVETIIRQHNARILEVEEKFIVIEKTGLHHETEALLTELRQYGIYEFVRSGRVAIAKPLEQLNTYLKSLKKTWKRWSPGMNFL